MTNTKQHQCPYGGIVYERTGPLVGHTESGPIYQSFLKWDCGVSGMLCDRCKEDRADARARRIAAQKGIEVDPLWTATRELEEHITWLRGVVTGQNARFEALEARLPGPQTRTQDLGTHSMAPRRTPEELDAVVDKVRQAWTPEPAQDEPTQHGDDPPCSSCGKTGYYNGIPFHDNNGERICHACWTTEREARRQRNLETVRQGKAAFDEAIRHEPTQPEARTCGNCGHGSRFTPGCSENWVTRCGAPLPMWAGQGSVNVLPDQDATNCAAWTPKEATHAL